MNVEGSHTEAARDDHDHYPIDHADGWAPYTVCPVEWPRMRAEGDQLICQAGSTWVERPIQDVYDCGCKDMTWEVGAIMVAAMFLGFVIGRRSLA